MWKSYALSSKYGPFANCRRDGWHEVMDVEGTDAEVAIVEERVGEK